MFYLLTGREREELNTLIAKLKQNLPTYGDTLMTYAEELIQEGIKKGRQEGRQETQFNIARNLLQSGVEPSIIAQATNLTLEQLKTIN